MSQQVLPSPATRRPVIGAAVLRRCVRIAAPLLPVLLVGCGTLTVPSTQPMQILAFDALDRPVAGLDCKISNAAGAWTVKTPGNDVPVRRSFSDLEIDCRRGTEVAMGTVAARRDGVEQALVPFGSVAVAIDHLTGHLYSYPSVVRLRLGQHLRFEFSNEARAAGLIATVGDSMVADLAAPPVARQPLPESAPAASAPAERNVAKPRNTRQPGAATARKPAAAPTNAVANAPATAARAAGTTKPPPQGASLRPAAASMPATALTPAHTTGPTKAPTASTRSATPAAATAVDRRPPSPAATLPAASTAVMR